MPDQSERDLWHQAMRDVTRSRGPGKAVNVPMPQARPEPVEGPPAKAARKGNDQPAAAAGFVPGPNQDMSVAAQVAPGIDRRQAQRLRRGQLPIEARLDLHGMTQGEAHRALAGFVARSHATGKRVLLIVTGKGTRTGADGSPSGVLRRNVPRWLAEPGLRPLVLTTAPALRRDGGDGALYLLLRRSR